MSLSNAITTFWYRAPLRGLSALFFCLCLPRKREELYKDIGEGRKRIPILSPNFETANGYLSSVRAMHARIDQKADQMLLQKWTDFSTATTLSLIHI